MKHLVSISDLDRKEIETILQLASGAHKQLPNKILCSLFFEPSTRTRLSFEAAALRLGMNTLGTENALLNSSSSKGESLEDTIRVVSSYADVIVLRHPHNEAALIASQVSTVPIINAGCGSDEHPTQTLTDLFTVNQRMGRLENLNIGFVGDIKNSRTVHSLAKASQQFNNVQCYYFPVIGLEDPTLVGEHKNVTSLSLHIGDLDVLYVTREQKERGSDSSSYFILTEALIAQMKTTAIILHPLPRNAELPTYVDKNMRAAYFDQAANAVAVRQGIVQYLLNPR